MERPTPVHNFISVRLPV